MLKPDEREDVIQSIEQEGFGYTFIHYDDFKEIKDEEFHKLREEFVKAAQKLADYLYFDL